MRNIYDLTFIGSGPSTIFAILKLIEKGYNKSICIIEKGKSLESRDKKEVISGWSGAGCFSDSKLSSALDVGGTIPGLKEEELEEFNRYLLETFNKFKKLTSNVEELTWDVGNDYFLPQDSTLSWNTHKTCHVGTDNGQAIYYEMEKYVRSFPFVHILFEKEALDVIKEDNLFRVKLNDKSDVITQNLVLATGQKNVLPGKVIKNLKLKSKPRNFQLGVRVVDTINPAYEEIIKANYDFKFVKNYSFDDNKLTIRIRTFCCNSGNAHVCAEKTNEGFVCFNGHAYKNPDPTNDSVNYGIMCEISGLKNYKDKSSQIALMKCINKLPYFEEDNYDKQGNVVPKRKLLEGFEHLKYYYPDEVIEALNDFATELNKIVDLSKAYYLYPEVKLSGLTPSLNYNTFQSKDVKGLYMIGDCVLTRGIVKSAYTGYKFALNYE